MIEVDGSCYSGSGTIVRQGVALAALTGQSLHIVNARVRRPKPGLRAQHVRVVHAICELVGGTAEGLEEGSRELVFRPGAGRAASEYRWDIGTAGSATMLAVAVLPVLAFQRQAVRVHIQGGLFQDFAPSVFHIQQVLLPLLRGMGLEAELTMLRPGYVPRGDGQVVVSTMPAGGLRELVLEDPGRVERVRGIALASHLQARRVGVRMAEAARAVLAAGGQRVAIEVRDDETAAQPGAALALFADCSGGVRSGADGAGAPGRPAEAIGRTVAAQLLEELKSGAAVDRFAADQLIPFAALAQGESRFTIPHVTEHVQASAWLVQTILGAGVRVEDHRVLVAGVGFSRS